MPYSLVLKCVAPEGGIRREDLQGQKGLALFLEGLLARVAPDRATGLHAPGKAKPFTTAILAGPGEARRRSGQADAGSLRIRVTLLDDALYALLMRGFLTEAGGRPARLRLGSAALEIAEVLVTPESREPWAGYASFDDLRAKASESDRRWVVRFCSPTNIRRGNADVPLPDPRLVFQSWLTSWEENSPSPFLASREDRQAFLERVAGEVGVHFSTLRTASHELFFDGRKIVEVGFVGVCRFLASPKRLGPADLKMLNCLVDYAFYCGTGRKTTMGMGLTRRLDGRESEQDGRA